MVNLPLVYSLVLVATTLADNGYPTLRPDARCKYVGQFLSHPRSRCLYVRCDYGNEPWHTSYGKVKLFAREMACAPGTSVPGYFDTAKKQGNPCTQRTNGGNCKGRYTHRTIHKRYGTFWNHRGFKSPFYGGLVGLRGRMPYPHPEPRKYKGPPPSKVKNYESKEDYTEERSSEEDYNSKQEYYSKGKFPHKEEYSAKEGYEPKGDYGSQKEYSPKGNYVPKRDYPPKERYAPKQDYPQKGDYPQRGHYPPEKDYPTKGDYATRREYQSERDYAPPRVTFSKGDYNTKSDYPSKDYNPPRSDYPTKDDYPTRSGYSPKSGQLPKDDFPSQDYNPARSDYPTKDDYPTRSDYSPKSGQLPKDDFPSQDYNPPRSDYPIKDDYPTRSDYSPKSGQLPKDYSPPKSDYPFKGSFPKSNSDYSPPRGRYVLRGAREAPPGPYPQAEEMFPPTESSEVEKDDVSHVIDSHSSEDESLLKDDGDDLPFRNEDDFSSSENDPLSKIKESYHPLKGRFTSPSRDPPRKQEEFRLSKTVFPFLKDALVALKNSFPPLKDSDPLNKDTFTSKENRYSPIKGDFHDFPAQKSVLSSPEGSEYVKSKRYEGRSFRPAGTIQGDFEDGSQEYPKDRDSDY